jgi:hypothetical protein
VSLLIAMLCTSGAMLSVIMQSIVKLNDIKMIEFVLIVVKTSFLNDHLSSHRGRY